MATSTQVQQLYIAYFGRPADAGGLANWTLDESATLETIADTFAGTDEYKAATEGNSVAAIINGFYRNLFARECEIEGLNYWVAEIAAGRTSTQQVGQSIAETARTADPANSDTDCLAIKVTASEQWTTYTAATTAGVLAYSGVPGIEAGVSYLNSWPNAAGEAPTQAETDASADALIAGNATGDSLELSVFQDVADSNDYTKLAGITILETSSFKLNGENQIVNGSQTTMTDGDVLADSSTSDSDVLNLTLTAPAMGGAGEVATISNIERINIISDGMNGDALQDLSITGAKSFVATGNVANNGALTLDASATGATTIDASGLTFTGSDTDATTALTGGNGGVTVTGSDLADSFSGGTGADIINLAGGTNTVDAAGNGADAITSDTAGGSLQVNVTGTTLFTIEATAGALSVTSDNDGSKVDASASTIAVSFAGGTGSDTVTGGSVADTLNIGNGGGSITGNAGNDTMTGGTGTDTIVQGASATSTAVSASSIAATANVGATTSYTFGNGVDIVTSWTSATDKIDVSSGAGDAPTTLVGVAGNALVNGTNYVLKGGYTASTGVFLGSATGVDVLFVQGGTGINSSIQTNNNIMLLINAVATGASLVAGDII